MPRAKVVYSKEHEVDPSYKGLLTALQSQYERRSFHELTLVDAIRKDRRGALFCLRLRRDALEKLKPAITEGWTVRSPADYPIGEICAVDEDRDEIWVSRMQPVGNRPFENPIRVYQPDFLGRLRDWLEERQGRPLPSPEQSGDSLRLSTARAGDSVLRESQRQSIEQLGLGVNCIWGPPGTGKTYTVAWAVQGLLERGFKVAVLAPTNVAVDTLVLAIRSAFIRAARPLCGGELIRAGQPALKELNDHAELMSWQAALAAGTFEIKTLSEELGRLTARRRSAEASQRQQLKTQIETLKLALSDAERRRGESLWTLAQQARVLATTVYSAQHRAEMKAFLSTEKIALVIDEAGMVPRFALLPLLELLSGGLAPQGQLRDAPSQVSVILAGDPKQLAPIYREPPNSKDVNARYWMGHSLLEELLEAGASDIGKKSGVWVLRQQSRMDVSICRRISKTYYYGLLETVPDPARPAPPLVESWPADGLLLLDSKRVSLPEDSPPEKSLRRSGNIDQRSLQIGRKLIQRALERGVRSVLWLSPFRDQARLARKLVDAYFSNHQVSAGTVHTSQGREADLIIFDPVRVRHRWLRADFGDPLNIERLLNVAVSRGRGQVIVLTSRDELRHNHIFLRLLHNATVADIP